MPRFLEVFQVLGTLKRRFPARVLRDLKEQVYELVRTSEPGNTVVVSDLEADTDVQQVDVVIGVGVNQRLASHGIVGLTRRDLIEDVLTPRIPKEKHAEIVANVLPGLARDEPTFRFTATFAAQVCSVTKVQSQLMQRVAAGVRARSRLGVSSLRLSDPYYVKRVSKILEKFPDIDSLIAGVSVKEALLAIPSLDDANVDAPKLREFLLANANLLDQGNGWTALTGSSVCASTT